MSVNERGESSRLDPWVLALAPFVLAGLTFGGWLAWRWWTTPAPFTCWSF